MKLLRLKLENWRGVDSREIKFANGVTLIEGPNEIGKSTIVEAIQNLFTVMDSSSKANIKAIQPVGKDVGSRVEVEAEAGEYLFVYAKTYNKNRQTELSVLAPKPVQLTGREAHERVEQILDESVDMALWNALLVEQGSEIAGVNLSRSDGLARALDEAAGGDSPEEDDSDLFARVQAEYEQYFTLRTRKPKYAALENEVSDAQASVEAARTAMLEIEVDNDNHDRCLTEVRRLEIELPGLRKEEEEHEANWRAISEVKEQVAIKQSELEIAGELLRAASEEAVRRQDLLKSLRECARQLNASREAQAPQADDLGKLEEVVNAAKTTLDTAKVELKNAREVAELAHADVQHLEDTGSLESANRKLSQLQNYSTNLAAARASLQGVKIDHDGLEALRGAESDVQMAQARLDIATSSIEIVAEDRLKLVINDEDLALEAGSTEQRAIASEMRMNLPGVASIRITPSQSANDLQAEAGERREILARLLRHYGVEDLADAVAVEAKRASNERDAKSWSEKIDELMGDESLADLQAYLDDLQVRCREYLADRTEVPILPAGLAEAQDVKAQADRKLAECEETVEAQQAAWDRLREEHADVNTQHSLAQLEISGLEQILEQRQQDLERSRATETDEALETRVQEKADVVGSLKIELARLSEQLESASPEAAEALFANAQAASQRAAKDLSSRKTELAILEDRLTKAQADGRFESLEDAENKLAALEDDYSATSARAAAVARLWQVLNSHRDAARREYVRPLKKGIEQLGKIVFGSDFAIELGDNWDLVSRTQDGKTIPFDDLSVGAKEQLGILMRLAAARIVSSQGGVPLIIDDALGFSDPLRLKTMGAAIASAGNDCQVILLTCTPGRFTHVGSAEVVRF